MDIRIIAAAAACLSLATATGCSKEGDSSSTPADSGAVDQTAPSTTPSTANQAAEDARKAASDAASDAAGAANEQFTQLRDQAATTLTSSLSAADSRWNELKSAVEKLGENAPAGLNDTVATIRTKIDDARAQLDTLSGAGADTWQSVKTSVEEAVGEITTSLNSAFEQLKTAVPGGLNPEK